MSSGSERMIEKQQEREDYKLAQKLGITYEELLVLDYEIDTEESDDGLIYNYIVKFRENAPREILDKINGMDENNYVWLPFGEFENDDYYKEQYDAIIADKNSLLKFQEEVEGLNRLNELELKDKSLEVILKRQIFIGVIGTFETFLSDTFITLTMDNDKYFRNFVETYPEFEQRKFELRYLFIEQNRIKETAKKVMLDIIYHNLPKVSNMYAATFKIDFPKIEPLTKCISIRHDLVHRNGRTKEGKDVVIEKATITELIGIVNSFVMEVAAKLGI